MKPIGRVPFWLPLALAVLGISTGVSGQTPFVYGAMCDASAAVALDANHFAVANDEKNTLMIYRRGKRSPVSAVDLSSFLVTKKDKESDLEGAASIDGRTFWISSHGRNSSAERQERRLRLFATDVVNRSSGPTVVAVGRPYLRLLDDLVAAPGLSVFKLRDAAAKAPEENGGLNIEGLAATNDRKLLIGFRNPIPDQKALVVPLENPQEVIEGKVARFGAAIQLNLANRGIRSIERIGSSYLIVAGPAADIGSFSLYRWSGDAAQSPVILDNADFKGLRPEAMFAIPGSNKVQFLSDDGQRLIGGVECKRLDKSKQSFRSLIVDLP